MVVFRTIYRNRYFFNKFSLVILLFLASCSTLKLYKSPEERRIEREKVIESFIKDSLPKSKSYESLGFGPLNVYKPSIFISLDSLYEVKYQYEKDGRIAEYSKTNNDELIEEYKKEAKKHEDKIEFEIEHIYSIKNLNELTIYHDYFLLDYKDSILNQDKLYHYRIPSYLKDIQMKYLFELHFTSNHHNRLITEEEYDFIKFFKAREQELIGNTRKLNEFMTHTLILMTLAERLNTINFVKLTKFVGERYLDRNFNGATMNSSQLIVEEDDQGNTLNYLLSIEWIDETEGQAMKSVMTFSPYLELEKVDTEKN